MPDRTPLILFLTVLLAALAIAGSVAMAWHETGGL